MAGASPRWEWDAAHRTTEVVVAPAGDLLPRMPPPQETCAPGLWPGCWSRNSWSATRVMSNNDVTGELVTLRPVSPNTPRDAASLASGGASQMGPTISVSLDLKILVSRALVTGRLTLIWEGA